MGFMKTTVELPDELLIAAKKMAAELRRPLRSLLEVGLRKELQELSEVSQRNGPIRWRTFDGGLPPGMDLRDREKTAEWIIRQR